MTSDSKENKMKITILGAGAMGMLFGGYLSQHNEVWLLDVDQERVKKIQSEGVSIREADGDRVFHPNAVTDSVGMEPMDLVIVFVKSMYTESALQANRRLIDKNTYLMTLQNGAGHESKLLQFADREHVIIGTTQHNSSIIENGYVNHGGGGKSSIGLLAGGSERVAHIAESFTACGLECVTNDAVKEQIWRKLFINTAASSLTAILQVPLGFIFDDTYARAIMHQLCHEAVQVANAEGYVCFSESEAIAEVEQICKNAPNGYTSIYADIKNGVRSEVDTISGSVVEAAKGLGVPVPCHEMVVDLIHAIEHKKRDKIS